MLFVIAVLNGIVGGTVSFGMALVLGAEAGVWIPRIVPPLILVLSVFLVRGLSKEVRRGRRLVEQDLHEDRVSRLTGSTASWYYSQGSHRQRSFEQHREFPVLVGDLGSGQRLLLTGEKLFEPDIYGCNLATMSEDEPRSSLNGLPVPFGFPTTKFSIEYWPRTGELIAIEPGHELVDPVNVSVDSLQSVGWDNEIVLMFEGDPGLKDSDSRDAIELS